VPLQLPLPLLEAVAWKCGDVSGMPPVVPVMPRPMLMAQALSPLAVESVTWRTPGAALVHVTWVAPSPPPV